jgi:SAM-dependent methyltransferase
MDPELTFRTDLYRGTAAFYARYRPPYPASLLEDLAARLPVSGRGRLLDLACGTGQVALPLAERFTKVVAVDQEEEMVAYGRAEADAAGVANIRWIVDSAETVGVEGPFELVTIGNAFHRLKRQVVAERVFSLLEAGGGIALLWSDPLGRGDSEWQSAMGALFDHWMSKLQITDRVPAGWQAAMDQRPHEEVLVRAGFEYLGKYKFFSDQTWTVETFTGLVYSTSFLNLDALRDNREAFETDLSRLLYSYEPSGVVQVLVSYEFQLARKTGTDLT